MLFCKYKYINELFFIFTFYLFLSSCNKTIERNTLIENTHIAESSIDSILKVSKFIKLETTTESLIGGYIGKIRKFNDKYYVSSDRKDLLVFFSDGRYSHKINKLGNGPGEYTLLSDYDILPNNDIAILDVRQIIIYNEKGELKKIIPLKITGFNIKDIDGKEALICASGEPYVIYKINYAGEILKQYLKNKQSTSIGSNVPFIPVANKQIVFQIGYSNNFMSYDIIKKSCDEVRLLNDKACLSSEKEDKLLEQYGFNYLDQYADLKIIYGISSYDNYILFKSGNNSHHQVYIADVQNNILKYKSTQIERDDEDYTNNLPIDYAHIGVADDCFITYIPYIEFISMSKPLESTDDMSDENPVLLEFIVR